MPARFTTPKPFSPRPREKRFPIHRINILTKTLALATILAAALFVDSANAGLILVDLSAASSPTFPASDGKYWNSLGSGTTDASIVNLVDQNNNPTGIGLSIDVTATVVNSGSGFGGTAINGPSGADPFDEPAAIIDGIFANNNFNGTAVLTLTGLDDAYTYDFAAIGGRASNGVDGAIDLLTGSSSSSTYALLNNGTVATFTVTSSGGVISFRFREGTDNTTSDNATFNAFSVNQVVPEPGSLALLCLGGLGLLGLVRRYKRQVSAVL